MKKKFKASSARWLQRQMNDEYVKQAQVDNYRCRSAYKLLEIQHLFKIFKPGQTVVDLGCSPGSWTQVAVAATKAEYKSNGSLVVGLDLNPTLQIPGAVLLDGLDFGLEKSREKLEKVLKKRKVNVVLSDMAPNTTGTRFVDHMNVSSLCYDVLRFVQKVCDVGASLVMKVFDGEECKKLMKDSKSLFQHVRVVYPKATRKPSSEMFYVGFRYKGVKLLPDKVEEEMDEEDD